MRSDVAEKGTKFKGIICDRCGVKVTHSRVRRKRMGHINLAAPIVHIWFFKVVPNNESKDVVPIALILFFEGQGHGLTVMNRHMADGQKVAKTPHSSELYLPSSRSGLVKVLEVLGYFGKGYPQAMR